MIINTEEEYIVEDDQSKMRLDCYLSDIYMDITRSHIKNLIDREFVKVNGKVVKAGYALKVGDKVAVTIPTPEKLNLEAQNIPIDIVYEDEYLAVINKPNGMVVHPAPGSPDNTLVNALLYNLKSLSSINGVIRPGIVHRLDKDTSGLLVVAKTDYAHVNLQSQIADKTCKRRYIALVCGHMPNAEGDIIANVDRSKKDGKLMAVCSVNEGRYAETHYIVDKIYKASYSLVRFELKTGRTHQIRVHCKSIGHSIVGDAAYGGSVKLYDNGQLLHAYELEFTHPISGERLTFNAEMPNYFKAIIDNLN